jgi:hypothetical protein
MKRALALSLGVCVLMACLAISSVSAAEAKASSKTVTIMNLGGSDEAALAESVVYFSKNVPLPVRSVTLPIQASVDAVLQAVAKARTENDAIVIALVALKNVESAMLVDSGHALALVNTEAVRQLSRKPVSINQAILRALAAELGVGYSVDPNCVNRRVATPAEFAKLGGNFCPPTLQQLLLSAGECGVNTTVPARKRVAPVEKK